MLQVSCAKAVINVESLFPVHSAMIHSRRANLSILSMTHCTYNLFNDFSRTNRFAIWFETKLNFSGFCLHELIPGSHLSVWGFNRTGHPRVGSGSMLFWKNYLRNVILGAFSARFFSSKSYWLLWNTILSPVELKPNIQNQNVKISNFPPKKMVIDMMPFWLEHCSRVKLKPHRVFLYPW